MKDWKFLQVGNTKTGNYESSTQRPDSKIYQTIHEFIKTSGGDADKAFVAIKRKYPNLTDEFIEKSIDEVIRTNKAGNESIDKQEWSLYQGLKKDAEKEIGNVLPPSGLYAKLLDEICEKEGIDSNKAREKYGQYSIEQWEKLLGRKIGNSDTVSEYNAEIQRLTKKAEQLLRMGQGKSAMEIEKQIEKLGKEMRELGNKKTGNEETKAERKFGKVMGEFEEGALKTPQGKTVTDPAQAKAIAYSEADKVDNLKRARNAMNKKCGNAQITLWKGNDTVLISEDGTVQYLESNSFEVDRDKYDSQQMAIEEMTKKGYRKK